MVHIPSHVSAPASTSNSSRDFEQRSALVRKKIFSCTHRNLAWKKQNGLKQLDSYRRDFEELEWNKWGNRSILVSHAALHHLPHFCPLFLSWPLLSFFFQCYLIRSNTVALKWIVCYQLVTFSLWFQWFSDRFGITGVSTSCFTRHERRMVINLCFFQGAWFSKSKLYTQMHKRLLSKMLNENSFTKNIMISNQHLLTNQKWEFNSTVIWILLTGLI